MTGLFIFLFRKTKFRVQVTQVFKQMYKHILFRDAEVMRLKQQKAAEKKAATEGGEGSSKK